MMCPMLAHCRGEFEPKTGGYMKTILVYIINIYNNI